jgi:hypothetical protein
LARRDASRRSIRFSCLSRHFTLTDYLAFPRRIDASTSRILWQGNLGSSPAKVVDMAKSQQKSNKEIRKPKAEKVKTNVSNPSTKSDAVKMVTIKS